MTYTLIPGQSHAASEEETLSMIRSVLTEDVQPEPTRKSARKNMPRRVAAPSSAAPKAASVPEEQPRRAAVLPELQAEQPAPAMPKSKRKPLPIRAATVTGLIKSIHDFRPTARHLAIVSTLLLIVVRPHWFVIGAVLICAMAIGAFLTLGADRIWHRVLRRLDRVEAKNPARAAALRAKLDGFAYRWDGFLDMFPDGMVDSLYMPDFQTLGQSEERHTNVMSDRLARMGQEG
mmetsp:Transcript_22415/g.36086  ORF Transcript_22415/g.36086 Transcript_22415/m.36086 type:complete len:233 (+) Transcript_22415:2824-3522(+)